MTPAVINILALIPDDDRRNERAEFLKDTFDVFSVTVCSKSKDIKTLSEDNNYLVIAHLGSEKFDSAALIAELSQDNMIGLIGLSDLEYDIVDAMENGFSDVVMHNNLRHLKLVIERELAGQSNTQSQDAIEQQNYSDFTGVHSRLEFLEHLTNFDFKKQKDDVAIVYLQLDNFGWINENLGMTAGDTYLRDIGKLLRNLLPESDFPARYQGGNFIMLLAAENEKVMTSKVDMIREAVLELSTEFNDAVISSTASIGVRELDSIDNLRDLIANAYDASDVARSGGGDTIHYYQHEHDDSVENLDNRNWNERIKKAFDKDLFILYFQPIVSIQSDSEPRYEVLLRMQDEVENIISPGTFLPFAERAGLMSDIDRKVIVNSMRQGLVQQEEHLPELFIKLSGKSVDDKSMPNWIAKTVNEIDFPADRLVFEITESIALHHLVQTRNLCTKLKEIGCKVALDHFGTRFRSFKLLQSLHVDYLKIDGSLVQHLSENKAHQTIVNKIVRLASKNDIQLIAESVQEAAFLPIIWQYNIPYVQGYFLGVPTENMDYDFRNLLI